MTRRIALASLLVVALVVGLVGVAIYDRFGHELRQQDDAQLEALAARPLTLLLRPTSGELAELRSPGGTTLYTTPALHALGTLPALQHGFATVEVAHHSLRVYSSTLPGGRVVVVALDRAPNLSALTRLRRLLALGGLAAAVVTALALTAVTRLSLAPLRRVAELAETITRTGDLGHRAPAEPGSHEPAQLARSINAMLDRLHASDEALRRLVADASHELRTPLTTLRGNLELLRASPALDEPDRTDALRDAAAEVERMQALVDDMLDLAQSEAVGRREPLALDSLVDGAPVGVTVLGARTSLSRMLDNLQRNAARYAGGAEVSAHVTGDVVHVRVIDHGPGIAEEERARIFDRFARGRDQQGTPGSGLGLAIARNIARSHGGDIALEPTPGGGATFVVTLPRAGPD